jgi:hypothetical protein
MTSESAHSQQLPRLRWGCYENIEKTYFERAFGSLDYSIIAIMKHIQLDPQAKKPPTRDHPHDKQLQEALPKAIQTRVHPTKSGNENASIFFVGNATTIL